MPADAAVLETPATSTPTAAPTPAPAAPAPAQPAASAPAATPAPVATEPKPAEPPVASLLDDLDDDGDAAPAADATKTDEQPTTEPKTDEEKPPVGDFPDDWRERFVKAQNYGDKKDAKGRPISEKVLAQLKRFKSVPAALEALISAQEKIRSGDLKAALAEDATDEEKAAWREANGLPPEPTKYDIPNVAGNKWTEADAPVLDGFKEVAFKHNLPQETVNDIVSYYANLRNEQVTQYQERIQDLDRAAVDEARTSLIAELGGDFKPSMKLVDRFMKDTKYIRGDLREKIESARLPSGERLALNADFTRLLVDLARAEYGEGAMVSSNEQTQVNNREAELVNIMQTDIHRYNNERNTKGETLAEELYRIRSEKAARSGGRR